MNSVSQKGSHLSKKVVAGLDLSLRNTGIAVISEQGVFCHSVGYPLESPTEREQVKRMMHIAAETIRFCKEHKVVQVALENYAFMPSQSSLTQIAELNGVIKAQSVVVLKTVPLRLAPTQVRKFLLGKGSAKKEAVQNHLKKLGYTQATNADEFDALAVALVLDAWANQGSQLSEYQKSVIEEINKKRW